MDLSSPLFDTLRTFWLLGLTVAFLWVVPRVRRLEDDVSDMTKALYSINQKLDGLARAQQVDDLRRQIVGDLRPLITEAVEVRLPRQSGTVVGQVTTGGGAAAVSGTIADERKER